MSALRGIVLAAGESRRMGSSKALLELQGKSLVEQHVVRLLEVGCTSVAVLVRPEVADAVRALLRQQAQVLVEPISTGSQAESLTAGLRVLTGAGSAPHDVLIVTPVDMLPARAETYRALLGSVNGTTLAATPLYCGRGGHPIVASRLALHAYEAADLDAPSLRDVLARLGTARGRVEVEDPLVLGDYDTPDDVAAARCDAAREN